ncbi:MAG: TIGR02266 family protein [Myxococcales bacterium]|nr:TIGR02266 family protein [Myxococcales bacterium]
MNNRRSGRAPLKLAVNYRTRGAFLVAYSVNLSKGGVFIEAEPLPVGSDVRLSLTVPGVGALEVDGLVTWVREANSAGLPVGMGIHFRRGLDVEHGEAIDRLVSTFEGLEILVVGSADRRALLRRYAASILACDTVEGESLKTAAVVINDGVDLVIVDLDTSGGDGLEVVRMARGGAVPTPIIALAGDEETRDWARAMGVDQVVRDPPTFAELQQAVLAALSRPTPG